MAVYPEISRNWKKTKYHTVGIVPKSNIKVVERDKSIFLTHINMTVECPGLVQALQ